MHTILQREMRNRDVEKYQKFLLFSMLIWDASISSFSTKEGARNGKLAYTAPKQVILHS